HQGWPGPRRVRRRPPPCSSVRRKHARREPPPERTVSADLQVTRQSSPRSAKPALPWARRAISAARRPRLRAKSKCPPCPTTIETYRHTSAQPLFVSIRGNLPRSGRRSPIPLALSSQDYSPLRQRNFRPVDRAPAEWVL